ncbi:MAG: hypothetical protein COB09_19045 [Thalassobium sp.]|nr:MAG: hypothetical protein COB09_19045 [Thalassobium sp.]
MFKRMIFRIKLAYGMLIATDESLRDVDQIIDLMFFAQRGQTLYVCTLKKFGKNNNFERFKPLITINRI